MIGVLLDFQNFSSSFSFFLANFFSYLRVASLRSFLSYLFYYIYKRLASSYLSYSYLSSAVKVGAHWDSILVKLSWAISLGILSTFVFLSVWETVGANHLDAFNLGWSVGQEGVGVSVVLGTVDKCYFCFSSNNRTPFSTAFYPESLLILKNSLTSSCTGICWAFFWILSLY